MHILLPGSLQVHPPRWFQRLQWRHLQNWNILRFRWSLPHLLYHTCHRRQNICTDGRRHQPRNRTHRARSKGRLAGRVVNNSAGRCRYGLFGCLHFSVGWDLGKLIEIHLALKGSIGVFNPNLMTTNTRSRIQVESLEPQSNVYW